MKAGGTYVLQRVGGAVVKAKIGDVADFANISLACLQMGETVRSIHADGRNPSTARREVLAAVRADALRVVDAAIPVVTGLGRPASVVVLSRRAMRSYEIKRLCPFAIPPPVFGVNSIPLDVSWSEAGGMQKPEAALGSRYYRGSW